MCLSKKLFSFLKIAKGSKVASECDWICKILKTFEIWVFFSKDSWFFQKKSWRFKKCLKLEKLPYYATGKARVLEMFRVENFRFLIKKQTRLSRKILIFFKIAKGRNFALECDWNSMIFQNVQSWKFGFFNKK